MISKTLLTAIVISPLLWTSCSEPKNNSESSQKSESELAAESRLAEEKIAAEAKAQADIEKKQADIIAKAEADTKAKKLALQLEEEQEAAEKAAEEKLQAEIAELEKKSAEQKIAWASYIGTKYEKLELNNGQTLSNAKVTEVRPTHVTYIHSAGIANVKFKDLSPSIRRNCKYDPELALRSRKKQDELQYKIKSRMAAAVARKAANNTSSEQASSNQTSSAPNSSINTQKPKKTVRSRGSLSIKSVGIDHRPHRHRSESYDGTQKNISIHAWANVDATVTVQGVTTFTISAGKAQTRTVSLIGGKYRVTLKDKNGKILDEERHNRKTGL